jgi:acetyl-CoA acetyltransferase
MREAVIVSYARTGLAKSNRGGFNNTHGAAMAGHAIQHAVSRAGWKARKSRTSSWAAAAPKAPPA